MLNFFRILFVCRPVSLDHVHRLFSFIVLNVLQTPFWLLEIILYQKKVNRHVIKHPPIFIIGHWRSGTTFLHQLLVQNKTVAYLNFYQAVFPKIFLITEKYFKPILQKIVSHRGLNIPYFNRIAFNWNFPCEEETALLSLNSIHSSYWAYVFPKNAEEWFDKKLFKQNGWTNDYLHLIKKISFGNNGKQLILKSPSNTARIPEILTLFPEAKFIYLERDPCEIYYSHLRLWRENIKNFALHKMSEDELDHIIISTYCKIKKKYNNDKALIPASHLYEISYETLVRNHHEEIKKIWNYLNLHQTVDQDKVLANTAYHTNYQPFQHHMNPERCARIEKAIGEYMA
jgi:hypothetical protein